jgi:hypothetical protein
MRVKNKIAIDGALLFARMNPRKRALVVTPSEEAATEVRDRLAQQNGGARPFNVKVQTLKPVR